MSVITPKTEAELAEVISAAGPFAVQGLGSKKALGRVTSDGTALSLSRFKGIEIYEPEELILEAGAATPLAEIQKQLDKHNQMLAFEPPDHGHLLGSSHSGSIGGLLATALAGPRRLRAGSVRDHVLAVRGVTGRGEMFKAGARVVKNVTGYDMPKLMAGSFGTLAALTSVTFKVLPRPETEQTVYVPGTSNSQAIRIMSDAMQSTSEISSAAHVPGAGTYLRFEGIAVSVTARRDRFVKDLQWPSDIMDDKASRQFWLAMGDCKILQHDASRALWRISVAPMQGAHVAEAIAAEADARFVFDWAGGLIWMSLPAESAATVRRHVIAGHAMLYAAPVALRKNIAVFPPQSAGVAALTKRLKAALDPLGKLNPGRMYEGM